MKEPLVSVIVPCYNQARFLPEAVGSVLAQTYSNLECIIVDDGSTDETKAVAERLADMDRRVQCVRQPNRGAAAARNQGLAKARGEFVQFLDADDALKARKLEAQLRALAGSATVAVVYCDYYYSEPQDLIREVPGLHRNPRFKTTEFLVECAARWETSLSIPIHCFLFDARFVREHGVRFDESLPTHEDWDCWMRIFALAPRVVFVDERLAVYRLNPQSKCTNLGLMRQGFLQAIEKQGLRFKDDPAMVAVLKRKRREVRRIYWKCSVWDQTLHYATSPLRLARRVLVEGLKTVLPAKRIAESQNVRRRLLEGK
jgi:glycosyltransferase involved in cell wall biosynthesis